MTAPNGNKIALDRGKIRGVRAALPGEYAAGVAAVIDMGRIHQGVLESPEKILAAMGPASARPVTARIASSDKPA